MSWSIEILMYGILGLRSEQRLLKLTVQFRGIKIGVLHLKTV